MRTSLSEEASQAEVADHPLRAPGIAVLAAACGPQPTADAPDPSSPRGRICDALATCGHLLLPIVIPALVALASLVVTRTRPRLALMLWGLCVVLALATRPVAQSPSYAHPF